MAEEDLAAAREAEEDEEEEKRVENKKKETRTKGDGGTQIAAAKKSARVLSAAPILLSSFRLFPRNLGAKLLSLYIHWNLAICPKTRRW